MAISGGADPVKPPTERIVLLGATGEPAFAVDDKGCIIAWNKAIERLLGHPAGEVLGKGCAEVIHGTDVFGNLYCCDNCPVSQALRRNEPVNSFEMDVRNSSGSAVRVAVTTLVLK